MNLKATWPGRLTLGFTIRLMVRPEFTKAFTTFLQVQPALHSTEYTLDYQTERETHMGFILTREVMVLITQRISLQLVELQTMRFMQLPENPILLNRLVSVPVHPATDLTYRAMHQVQQTYQSLQQTILEILM